MGGLCVEVVFVTDFALINIQCVGANYLVHSTAVSSSE